MGKYVKAIKNSKERLLIISLHMYTLYLDIQCLFPELALALAHVIPIPIMATFLILNSKILYCTSLKAYP